MGEPVGALLEFDVQLTPTSMTGSMTGTARALDADHLVAGAGASGMAFADALTRHAGEIGSMRTRS